MKEKLIAWLLLLAMLASYIVLHLQLVAAAEQIFDDNQLYDWQDGQLASGEPISCAADVVTKFNNASLMKRVEELQETHPYFLIMTTDAAGYGSTIVFSQSPIYLSSTEYRYNGLRYMSIFLRSDSDFNLTVITIQPPSAGAALNTYTYRETKVVSPSGTPGPITAADGYIYNPYSEYYTNAWTTVYKANCNPFSFIRGTSNSDAGYYFYSSHDLYDITNGVRLWKANIDTTPKSDYKHSFVNRLGVDYLKLSNIPGYDLSDDSVTVLYTDASGLDLTVTFSNFKTDKSEYGLLDIYIPVSAICTDAAFNVLRTTYSFGSTSYSCYDTVSYRTDNSSGDDGITDIPSQSPGGNRHDDLSYYIGEETHCFEDVTTGVLYGLSVPAWASIYAFYDAPTWDELADAAAVYDVIVTNYIHVDGKEPKFVATSPDHIDVASRKYCPVFFSQHFYQRQICYNLTDGINFLGNYLYEISQQNSTVYKLLYNQFSSLLTKFNLLSGKLDKLITILGDIDSDSLQAVLTWLSSIDSKLDKLDNLQPSASLDSNALDDLMQLLRDIKSDLVTIQGLLDDLITAVNDLQIKVTNNITQESEETIWTFLADILKMILKTLLNIVQRLIDFVFDIAEELFGSLGDLLGHITKFYELFAEGDENTKAGAGLALFSDENDALLAEVSSYLAFFPMIFSILPAPITSAFIFGIVALVLVFIVREIRS